MANSRAAEDYFLTAQSYLQLAQRLRDQAANAYSPEIRRELESMARLYELRAEISLRQSPSPHLQTPPRLLSRR